MAKLKGKSKAAAAAAATAGSANVKGASGDDTLMANPAPSSGPVEEICKEAAAENAAVLDDKSDGAEDNNKEEETEPEEIEDEGVEEETEDGLDAQLEEEDDDVEEDEDGLDDDSEEDSDDDDEVDDKSDEGDELEEVAKEENGVVVPVGTDVVPEGGKMVDNYEKVEGEMKAEKEKDDKKDDAKGEDTPDKKLKKTWMREKKTASASVAAAAVFDDPGKTLGNAVKQRAAAVEEFKLVYGMGMIFMCNAQTKQDCFRYNVLGLPESKKDMVAKIYKGMRLFLFDLDLKVLYGVYKAASAGGYNIEPEAFESEFPAQVRFKVIKDCPPLPEEQFKAEIKENYYGYNKFDCQLSPEQVKRLCKLFQKEGKNPKTKTSSELLTAKPELPRPARGRGRGRGKTWKAFRGEPERTSSAQGHPKNRKVIQAAPEQTTSARGRKRTREVTRAEPEQISSRGRKKFRHGRGRGRRDDSTEPEQISSRGRKKFRHGRGRGRRDDSTEPEQISSRGGKKFRHERGSGRRDDSAEPEQISSRGGKKYRHDSTPRSGERHRYAREDYPSPRGGDHLYAKRREVYPSPPLPGSLALPPPLPVYAYGLRGELRGDEYYYRRDPPPPQLLNPRDYGRDLSRDYQRAVALEARPRQPVEYRDAYSSMYREPIPYHEKLYMPSASYAAPPAAGLAPSAYAPPAASLVPSAYAPPAARLAPSAYAPPAASLAPSAYAPPAASLAPSAYAPSAAGLGPTTGFPPSAAGLGPTTGFPPSSSLYYRY